MTNPKSEIRIFDPNTVTLHGELLEAAFSEFHCGPVACTGTQRARMSRAQIRRRDRVHETCVQFTDLMNSSRRPNSEAETVAILAPVTAWLLQWLIQQLAIQVIKFLWRKWHEPPNTSIGQATGA